MPTIRSCSPSKYRVSTVSSVGQTIQLGGNIGILAPELAAIHSRKRPRPRILLPQYAGSAARPYPPGPNARACGHQLQSPSRSCSGPSRPGVDGRRHAFGIEFVAVPALDTLCLGGAIRHMRHRIGVGEAGAQDVRRRTASGNKGGRRGKASPMRFPGNVAYLKPPLPDDRTYSRGRETPAGIGVVIPFRRHRPRLGSRCRRGRGV